MTIFGCGNKGSPRQRLVLDRAPLGWLLRSPQQPESTLSVAPATRVGQAPWYQKKVPVVSMVTLVSQAVTAGT